MEGKSGLVHIYWGNGKGKTSAALGTALRACGHGNRVHLIQFMKNGSDNQEINLPGEIKALEKLTNFSFKRFGTGKWASKNSSEDAVKAKEALNYLKSCFNENYSIIIADEILYAVQLGLLEESDVIKLIKEKPQDKELVLTGSHIPFPNIFVLADYVTEIKKVKHPFDAGIKARKGIEY